jgi:hypothetical protein
MVVGPRANAASKAKTTAVRPKGTPDRLLVVFSDIEMGAGGAYDDFPHAQFLGELLDRYADVDLEVDLVFNGDTFDLLKTSLVSGGWPHHVTSSVAVEKTERVIAAHRPFFAGVDRFLRGGSRRRDVHFLIGNHDQELFFPAVQSVLREAIGGRPDHVHFPGITLDLGRVHVEHGAQLDPLFAIDPTRPFVDFDGQPILNVSWAAVALLDVVIPLQPLLYHHDRLRPKERVLELVPEVRELLTSVMWSYWTEAYWRDFLRGEDPLKTVSWTMLAELVRRLVLRDPDVAMRDDLQRRMLATEDFDLYLVGHQHDAGWWSHGGKKVIRTGALRDEFELSPNGEVQTPINKTWAEVWMKGEQVVRSHLVEVVAPPRPEGTMPASIFDVVEPIRARLAAAARLAEERVAQEAQVARERVRK